MNARAFAAQGFNGRAADLDAPRLPSPSQRLMDALDAIEKIPGAHLAVWERDVPGALTALRCWAIVRHLSLVERDVEGFPGHWVLACNTRGLDICVHAFAEHRRSAS